MILVKQAVLTKRQNSSSDIDFFDDTPYVWDPTNLQEYLNGTGKAGGPLVTTTNITFQSDLRLFNNTDGNKTVKAMAVSQKTFENTCFPIFQKMIDTVPKTGECFQTSFLPSLDCLRRELRCLGHVLERLYFSCHFSARFQRSSANDSLHQVTLSSPIGPSKWITMHSNLDFTATNAIAYSGQIGTYGKGTPPATASYEYGTTGG